MEHPTVFINSSCYLWCGLSKYGHITHDKLHDSCDKVCVCAHPPPVETDEAIEEEYEDDIYDLPPQSEVGGGTGMM